MRRRPLLYRYPLGVTLSLLLLLCALLFMWSYVFTLWGAQREASLRDASRALTVEITRQQRHLQEHLSAGAVDRVADELAALGTDTRLRIALVVDREAAVLASLRRSDAGRALEAALDEQGLDQLPSALASTVAEVRSHGGARVVEVPEVEQLVAIAPLDLPTADPRLGPREPGLLLIGWDLEVIHGLAEHNTLLITERFFPLLLVGALAAWGVLHPVVARRLRRLATTAERISRGELAERGTVDGIDEIGRLALAFNRMTDRLVAERTQLTESEQRLALSQRFGQIGSWEWDIGTNEVRWSEGTYDIFRLPRGSPMSFERYLGLIHPQDRDIIQDALRETLEAGAGYRVEVRTAEGDRWLLGQGDVLRDATGRPTRMYGVVQDVTERKRAEIALFNEKERLLVTLASIGDGVITTDNGGIVTFLNPVAEYMTGWRIERARGRPLKEVFPIVNELNRRPAPDPVARSLREGRIVGLANHTILVRGDGREFAIEDSAAPIRNREGETIGVVLVFHDVTGAREMANRLSWQASHDALTGLHNRVAFEERLRQLVHYPERTKEREIHTLLYIDLDQFKVVNDVAGHIAGDEVLKQISGLMQQQVRESDMLARLGGDEFGLILTHCDIAHAQRVANGIHRALEDFKFPWDERQFRVGASIGALEFHPGEASLTDLLRAADLACYAAKNAGRRRTHVYRIDDVHTQRHRSQMDWATRLNDAVEGDRLVLYGQVMRPIRDPQASAGLFVEVLVRMRDGDGQLILPGVFLPAAERFDLMTLIDRWIINRAFAAVAACLRGGADRVCHCALNLSGATLGDESLLPFLKSQLALHRVPAGIFCFEITETVAISNFPAALSLIRELRAMGCRFALDDFGSGLSSFSYLKNLPVDFLKIDGIFVRELARDPVNRTLVGNINDIGHLLGKQTVAECAEDAETVAILTELGVDFAQGYGIAPPQPLEELLPAASTRIPVT